MLGLVDVQTRRRNRFLGHDVFIAVRVVGNGVGSRRIRDVYSIKMLGLAMLGLAMLGLAMLGLAMLGLAMLLSLRLISRSLRLPMCVLNAPQ